MVGQRGPSEYSVGERSITEEVVLQLDGVHKYFGRNHALRGVDLAIAPGEVHGLLGKNGAGKSVLIKVIAGVTVPDSGEVRVRGKAVDLGSPKIAREAGVAVVYQELSLVPTMTIAENLQLGNWASKGFGLLDRDAMHEAGREALARVGLARDPEERLDSLGMAERQLVEIAKALKGDVSVLLLDEPTSSLSDSETRRLFDLVREVKHQGVAVIYVSHRMWEILELTDRVSILRDGRVEPPLETARTDAQTLAQLMVGDVVEVAHTRSERDLGEVVLEVHGLDVDRRLKQVDLTLRRGEILAVYGLMGAGRTRLARALFGLEHWTGGTAQLNGRDYKPASARDAIAGGVGLVGEDRSAGLVSMMTVAENIVLGSLQRFRRMGMFNRRSARKVAETYLDRLKIKADSVHARMDSLSGGNQQKVLLARWMCANIRVLILDDPVRGVDVGAKEEIFAEIVAMCKAGTSVLYFTSDADEARRLGDRILVMASGRVVAELPASSNEKSIVAAAGGLRV